MINSISKVSYTLVLLALLKPGFAHAGNRIWTYLGPSGIETRALAIDPTMPLTIYAATDGGGVFKSTNAGADWSPINSGLPTKEIYVLTIDPKVTRTLYIGTSYGIFKSTNGGDSWMAINTGLGWIPDSMKATTLAVDPKMTQTIYVGCNTGAIFKSTDGGANWREILQSFILSPSVVVDPRAPLTLYVCGSSVYKSIDGGDHWTHPMQEAFVVSLAIDPTNPQTIYAGTPGLPPNTFFCHGVFRSTDDGNNWTLVGQTIPLDTSIDVLLIDPTAAQTIYAGTDHGVFKSTDSGTTWIPINPMVIDISINAIALDPQAPQTIYIGSPYGIFKSTNGGINWNLANTGLPSPKEFLGPLRQVYVSSLIKDPIAAQTLYVGTSYGLYKSTNGGVSWSAINPAPNDFPGFRIAVTIYALAIDPTRPQTLYAGYTYFTTGGGSFGGMFKSTNGGSNWSAIDAGLTYPEVIALAMDPTEPQTLYVGTSDGVFKSTNGGNNWSALTGISDSVFALAIDPTAPHIIYAFVGSRLLKSTNGGINWSALAGIAGPGSIAIDPTAPQTIYAMTSDGHFKSTDGGSNWKSANAGLTGHFSSALAMDPTEPQTLYVGTSDGVFKSTNGGNNWIAVNRGLPNMIAGVHVLAIDATVPQTVYAGTSGVWGYSMPPTASTDIDLEAGGAEDARTVGSVEATQVGYAKVAIKSGTTPYGTAVFSFKQNGGTIGETGVPASPPTTAARIFIDYRSSAAAIPGRLGAGTININTGIAVVNNGSASAIVTYTLCDMAGSPLSNSYGTLAAGAHFAKFIDQLKDVAPDFALPANFQVAIQFASLEISSDQPLSILALRMTANQRNEVLFTTTPIADLTQPAANGIIFFPQFADGGGYTTSLVLLNTSNGIETGTLQILDDNGNPLVVNNVGGTAGSIFRYSIPTGGAFRFQTDGFPVTTKVGWARVTPDAGTLTPVGAGVFGYNPENSLVTESGIPATVSTTHARIYVDMSGGHNTGLAIANPASTNASIIITAYQSDGVTPVGTSLGPLQIPANGHNARFADQCVAELPIGFTGVLDIIPSTPVAVLTMRSLYNERHDFLLATFPVADMTRSAPTPIVFPQIADGGGYVTQFIFIGARGASSVTLNFYGEDGKPLFVGK